MFVMEQTQGNPQGNKTLLRSTLNTLQAFLTWIPLPYIFASSLIEHLLRLFALAEFRNMALKCLTEVGSLEVEERYLPLLLQLYSVFMQALPSHIPPQQIELVHKNYNISSDEDQAFVQNLAQFFTGFLRQHGWALLKTGEQVRMLETGLLYVVHISYVQDTEVFKICLDYWIHFVKQANEQLLHNMDPYA